MTAVSPALVSKETNAIPYVTAQEAHSLLITALERLFVLLEKLEPGDWEKPTACSQWNVRDMLAHQAGSYAMNASYKALFRQLMIRPGPGQLPEDAINAEQLRERAGRTPAEMIAELRTAGPLAADKWAYHFRLFKLVSIPHPVVGKLNLRHLMWVVHSRDTWMHRLDICRATGHAFEQTAEHDGRIASLVMRDVEDVLAMKFKGPALLFELTGIAGGSWKIGQGEPAAAIHMDVLDFNIFASGRYSYQQARPLAKISGDVRTAEEALKQILVLY
jgi:uncharacterized protein (TIGR03083 family)